MFRRELEGRGSPPRRNGRLAQLGAVPTGAIASAGGASRSQVWNRIRATVLGRPLDVPAAPTSAFGAALLAAAGTLHADLGTAVAAMVSSHHQVEPDRTQRAAMADSYKRIRAELRARGWTGTRPPDARD